MLVVNLFGAPGAGKSTGAAYIFAKLKMAGVNAELVTEFAKDMVWENCESALDDQPYVFGQQYHRLKRLEGKVDVVVTDSPILLSLFYCHDESIKQELTALVEAANRQFDALNFLVMRDKPYNPNGRLQDEKESDAIAEALETYLIDHHVGPEPIYGCQKDYDCVVNLILERLNIKPQTSQYGWIVGGEDYEPDLLCSCCGEEFDVLMGECETEEDFARVFYEED